MAAVGTVDRCKEDKSARDMGVWVVGVVRWMTNLGQFAVEGESAFVGVLWVAPGVHSASAWGTSVLSSQELSKEGGVVAVEGRWERRWRFSLSLRRRRISKAGGAKLCRREWELKLACFSTHIAFEV